MKKEYPPALGYRDLREIDAQRERQADESWARTLLVFAFIMACIFITGYIEGQGPFPY